MTIDTNSKAVLVTYDAVAAACEALVASGARASVRNIIAHLGGGSPNDVLVFQRQWKAGRPTVKVDEIQLDPRFGQLLAEQISRAVSSARADIEAQLTEAEQDLEAVAKAGQEARALAQTLGVDLDAAKAQIQAMMGQIEQLKADVEQVKADAAEKVKVAEQRAEAAIDKAKAEASREREASEAAQRSLVRAELRLEALPRLETDLADGRAELAKERQTRIGAEQQAAVLAAQIAALQDRLTETQKAQARAEQQAEALTGQLDAVRQGAKSVGEEAATLRGQMKETEHRIAEAQKAQARAEQQAEALTGQLDAARKDAKSAGEKAAILRGQIVEKGEEPAPTM